MLDQAIQPDRSVLTTLRPIEACTESGISVNCSCMQSGEATRPTKLMPVSPEAIPGALSKAERYRFLNEPWQAESICRDVLAIDPTNQTALILLVLSLTDQFDRGNSA